MKEVRSWSPSMSGTSSDEETVKEYQKWDHITLDDFRSSSCWTGFTYIYLWLLAVVAIAVYAADTYTAVVLLAYNRWPGQISPAIPFKVSRWLFAACIVFSWLLCAYQWFRAFRIMRRGSVVRDYLDPLAAILQSMRSWRRFLVFAELTKSRKGVDYLALFTYFQFKGALRILLAEGPRQAINGITLYAVMRSNLLPNGQSRDSNFDQFWTNVRVLAMQQHAHAIILFTMLFTLFIWVISAISLLVACLAWLCFLWHYVEKGNLSRWCKHKIEKRLRRIMEKTFAKELARQEKFRRAGLRPSRTFGSTSTTLTDTRRPTLPSISGDEKTLENPHHHVRQLYSIPVPPQTFRKGSAPLAQQPTLPAIEESPILNEYDHGPHRDNSNASTSTTSSAPRRDWAPSQPLVSSAADMASSRPYNNHSLPFLQPAIVPTSLAIARKPLPVRKDNTSQEPRPSDRAFASSNPGRALVRPSSHTTNQRPFTFQKQNEMLVQPAPSMYAGRNFYPPQPQHIQSRPQASGQHQGRYEPFNGLNLARPTPTPSSKSIGQRQPSIRQGPSTFAAMGL